MAWKKLKKFEGYSIALMGIMTIELLLFGFLLGYTANPNPAKEKSIVCYDIASINDTLNIIEKNCGGVFITHQFNNQNWFIFQSNVCDGKKCESKYIPIEQCINGGEGK